MVRGYSLGKILALTNWRFLKFEVMGWNGDGQILFERRRGMAVEAVAMMGFLT